MIDPDAVKSTYHLLSVDGVFGAAHTPTDGHVDASGATHALVKAARQLGAEIKANTPVTSIQKSSSGWHLKMGSDSLIAEHLVLAASFRTRELAAQIGLNLPLYALQHHKVIMGPVAELSGLTAELPTVQDPAAPVNIRQERDGFLCCVYEQGPKF